MLGLGEASVQAALDPPSTLAVAAPRTAAAAALGEGIQPSLIVSFPTLLALLEGLGLTEDPSIVKFVPYLRSATTLAGGGREARRRHRALPARRSACRHRRLALLRRLRSTAWIARQEHETARRSRDRRRSCGSVVSPSGSTE